MGKDSPSPPPAPAAPDPAAIAAAQAKANQISQFTPLGNQLFGKVGEGGTFVEGTGGKATQVQLTPDAQGAFDLEQQIAKLLRERALTQTGFLPSGPLDFSGLPGFTSELDFGALPGLPGGIDFSQFSSVPGGINTSGFGTLPQGIDFAGLTNLPGIDDFSADASRVRDAQFEQALGLLNPEFARAGDRLEQRLANQGLPIGGEAFEGEFTRFERGKDEARRFAAFNAIQAGGAEQSRLFGLATSARGQQVQEQLQDIATKFGTNSAQFQQALAQAQQAGLLGGQQRADALTGVNLGFQQRQQGLSEALQQIELARTGRTQGISEEFAQRGNVFNELASLLGTSQVQIPQFAPQAPIDVIGAFGLQQQGQAQQFQAQLAQFNAQQQSNQGFASGLFGLGSSGILGAASFFA